jgi:hypothetical protein
LGVPAVLVVVLVVAVDVVLVAAGVDAVAVEVLEDDLPEPQPLAVRARTSAAARLQSFIAVVLSAAGADTQLANTSLTTAGTL